MVFVSAAEHCGLIGVAIQDVLLVVGDIIFHLSSLFPDISGCVCM